VGNLTKIKDPVGNITENIYDSVGNKIKVISPRSAEVEYTYDAHGLVTSIKDPLGNLTAYDVGLNGLTAKMTLTNGGEYTYAYDELNRITNVTAPEGLSRTFAYDEKGNLAAETDNLGRTTSYRYDLMHRVTEIINPAEQKTSYSYDDFGNLVSVIDAMSVSTGYSYDLLNRVVAQTDPEGKVTQLQYDLAGNITSTTKSGGRTTTLAYDEDYNLTAVTDPMGYTRSQELDGDNRLVKSIDALGNAVSYQYDAAGRVIKQTDAKNQSVFFQYDPHNNITKATNQLGVSVDYGYDRMDRLTSVAEPDGRTTSYAYDSVGNLLSVTNANGKSARYTYNLEGNMTSITDENGKTEAMTYDLAGRLKSITRPDNTTVSYDYNKINSLVSKTYSADDTQVLYGYDELGRRVNMTDTTGATSYEYDIMGRITSVTATDGKTVKYAYDGCDRLASIEYADGRVVAYEYDLNDRLTAVKDGEEVTEYAYDALGRIISVSRPNGTVSAYQYDVTGNLTLIENMDSSNVLISSFAYDFDARGYIVKETAKSPDGTVTRSFTYNANGEITLFREKEGLKTAEYKYTYDKSGNRVKLEKKGVARPETVDYKYNSANQLVSETSTVTGKAEYEYDENGNVVSKQAVGERIITYEYTVENRLKAVREGGELLMAAAYDGDSNRIFQLNRKEVEQYVVKPDLGEAPDEVTAGEKGDAPGIANPYLQNEDTTQPDEYGKIPQTGDRKSVGDSTTGTSETPETYSYYEKVYADPADTIWWFGFGQGVIQYFCGINQALAAYLSDWFTNAWDYITGQYTLEIHSVVKQPGYSEKDIDALKRAGLSDDDISTITGQTPSESGTPSGVNDSPHAQNTSPDKGLSNKSAPNPGQGLTDKDDQAPIVIPANPDEKTRYDYDLTYYVNDVNLQNTQVLMEYGRRDELKSTYVYGLDRISSERLAPTPELPAVDGDEYTTDYYLYDGRGSVANVVSPTADILQSYAYDPFGGMTAGEPAQDLVYGYNAEEYNPATGLQYLRARYYDVETGRFGTEDTYLGQIAEPLTLNRYAYTTNNPVMQIDPSGHFSLLSGLKSIGSAISSGAKAVGGAIVDGAKAVGNTIVNGANWVNNNVIQPGISVAKDGLNWLNNTIIQPGIQWANNTFVKPVTDFLGNGLNKLISTGKQVWNSATGALISFAKDPVGYTKQVTANVRKEIEKFVCSTAEFLKPVTDWVTNTWDAFAQDPAGSINDIASQVVDFGGQVANTPEFGWLIEKVIGISNDPLGAWEKILGIPVSGIWDNTLGALLGNLLGMPSGIPLGIPLGKLWTQNDWIGAQEVIGLAIGARRDGDGVYHIDQDYWQSWKPIGYNDGYDNVFHAAIGVTGSSMDKYKSAEFTVDGKTYMLWSWKGSYMNIGAGAETGIYEKYSDTHWLTAPEKSANMELLLDMNGSQLYDYKPSEAEDRSENQKQWWITGFDSKTAMQTVHASDLTATTIIDFKTMDNGINMYNAFRDASLAYDKNLWAFDDTNFIAILRWEAEK
jgi:RHS repeat-associated protein